MKLSNNGKDRVTTGNFLLPNDTSITRIGLYLIELLAKGKQWKSPKNQGCG